MRPSPSLRMQAIIVDREALRFKCDGVCNERRLLAILEGDHDAQIDSACLDGSLTSEKTELASRLVLELHF